jgi:ABC-type nitrate/sulfonate/bicarbonate transport system substrate-binding protein
MRIIAHTLVALAAMSASAFGAELPVLRYGQAYSATNSVYSLPIAIAEREGLFAREGLDFRVVIPNPGGADRMIHALHDDTIDITHVATPFLVRAALAGSDAVAIAAEFNNPIYSLIAHPDIARIADLKGKLIGLADPGGSITVSMRKLLAMNGIRDSDVRVKTIEGTQARWNCLKRGECVAVPLGQPQDLVAQSEGFRLLGLSTDAVPQYVYTVTAVRSSWAQAHRDLVVRYICGLAAAHRTIRDSAKRPLVIKTIVETTRVTPAIAERTIALYLEPDRKVLPRQAEIEMAGFAQVIASMGDAGLLEAPLPSPDRFVDLQYLRAAGMQ